MTFNMDTLHYSAHERSAHYSQQYQHQEMLEKSRMRETFFSMANIQDRPNSVHTEFMETDWEMEDDDFYNQTPEVSTRVSEGSGQSSPRISIGSSGQPSLTTLSSYDEVQTPRSLRYRNEFPFESEAKQVEGPRGPHLFRSSMSSAQSIEFQNALSLSPVLPRKYPAEEFQEPATSYRTTLPVKKRGSGPFGFSDRELDTSILKDWAPEMVAQWMLNAGVELEACERFVENDITGSILITLKFEDLKELGIRSFGIRTKVWEEIHVMRDMQQPEPQPETPIEDEPDREARRHLRRQDSVKSVNKPKRRPSKPRPKINDVISPLESVSIVGIEQMMPKPHTCKKGENCPKYKRNQRMIEAFKKDHPFVNLDVEGGVIMVAGDPGNPQTAEAIKTEDIFRPVSDAIPSVVASSDVMGPGSLPPLQYLQEATLRSIQARDPQDNVQQFLNFQHHHLNATSEVPPTPPFEIYPQGTQQQAQGPHARLQALPKLSIPGQGNNVARREPVSAQPRSAVRAEASQAIPSFQEMSDASSAEEATPTGVYRFGTPFSEMDVPVTMEPTNPVPRNVSQSVPPDMNYRHNPAPPPRSMSRATIRRPSFPVLPALDENSIVTPVTHKPSRSFSQRGGQRPLQPPPRVQYPWTQTDRTTYEKAIAPLPGAAPAGAGVTATTILSPTAAAASSSTGDVSAVSIGSGRLPSPLTSKPKEDMTGGLAISYQGLMKKRKTKMLRHEWHDHYFMLRGTRLTMHKDQATAQNRTLEYIDIDDYAIACSSMAHTSKLNAAFKAMHIRRGSDGPSAKDDIAAFSFQLIPQDAKGGARLHRKRESTLGSILNGGSNSSAPNLPGLDGAVNGTGKTHHFAVKSRDERIDWMRELMLAKALRQKGEGVEITVNGKNMI